MQQAQLGNQIVDELPRTYFHLIQKAGSFGKYQIMLTIMFLLTWLCTGIILMTTAFLYLNPSFNCQKYGLLTADCKKFVCQLPEDQWSLFVPPEELQFKSLANSFDTTYYCDNSINLDLASSLIYLGAFIGYTVISFFSDNWGRRTSMVVSWTIGCVGVIILMLAQNLWMASCGLFLSAMGCDSAVNITIFVFGQVLQDSKRQSYSVIIMAFFPLGAIIITGLFYLLQDWQQVLGIGLAAPMIIVEVWMFFYLEQTPAFLVKKGIPEAMRALNRIAKINKTNQIITQQDIQNVIDNQQVSDYNKVITPLDLCRFPSLRIITICGSIVNFATYIMYYGPIIIVDTIGFDIYTSNIMLNLADLACYLPSYLIINKQPRRLLGMVLFAIATLMAGLLVFITKPEDCGYCFQAIIELGCICIFRFCISMQFTVLIIYMAELYPGRARAIGSGFVAAVGTVASTICPIFLGALERAEINVMIFFTVTGIIGVGIFTVLNETQGKTIPQEIEEIQMQKEKKRSQIRSIKRSEILKNKLSQIVSSQVQSNNLKSRKD